MNPYRPHRQRTNECFLYRRSSPYAKIGLLPDAMDSAGHKKCEVLPTQICVDAAMNGYTMAGSAEQGQVVGISVGTDDGLTLWHGGWYMQQA
jgi:hypothetical protein